MRNIIVDTNVFIGACIGSDASSKIIEMCILGKVAPIFGAALLLEYEDVLTRSTIFQNARLNANERDKLFKIFISKARWVNIYYQWRPNLPDEGDNHIVELAIAGNASTIVTRNLRDFKRGDLKFEHIRAISPEEFIRELHS